MTAKRLLAAALIPVLLLGAAAQAAETSTPSRFRDAEDGWFDASEFLDSAQGFLPLAMPITEPAVGYGVAGAVMFIERNVSGQEGGYTRPNMTMLGGLRTENGTRGVFATHLGTWREDSIRTIAVLADMNINLDYFGLGGGRDPTDAGVGYSISARGGLLGGHFRLGTTPAWVGLRYTLVQTGVSLLAANPDLPGILPGDTADQRIAALTPSLTLDTRDTFFTPTRGWYVDASALLARGSLGSDRSFERLGLTVIHYRPVARDLFLGMRGSARSSSDNTPFFLRPYVAMRGVHAMRYQGEDAGEVEAELRWQVHPRFSVVGFGGVGTARGSGGGAHDRDRSVTAGGAGVRYLVARGHGLHMGLDVAVGPDKPVIYLVLGSAWGRPGKFYCYPGFWLFLGHARGIAGMRKQGKRFSTGASHEYTPARSPSCSAASPFAVIARQPLGKIIAVIEEPVVIVRILTHLGKATHAPPRPAVRPLALFRVA